MRCHARVTLSICFSFSAGDLRAMCVLSRAVRIAARNDRGIVIPWEFFPQRKGFSHKLAGKRDSRAVCRGASLLRRFLDGQTARNACLAEDFAPVALEINGESQFPYPPRTATLHLFVLFGRNR